jgi:hypothetical protein
MSKSDSKVSVNASGGRDIGLALLLTFFFGPLGMFYSTVIGGIIMLIASVLAILFSGGIGLFFTWPIQLVWAAEAALKKQSMGN